MAGLTLAQTEALLEEYRLCASAISRGQEREVTTPTGTTRRYKRADLADVLEMIKYLQGEVTRLEEAAAATASGQVRSGRRTRQIAPG